MTNYVFIFKTDEEKNSKSIIENTIFGKDENSLELSNINIKESGTYFINLSPKNTINKSKSMISKKRKTNVRNDYLHIKRESFEEISSLINDSTKENMFENDINKEKQSIEFIIYYVLFYFLT